MGCLLCEGAVVGWLGAVHTSAGFEDVTYVFACTCVFASVYAGREDDAGHHAEGARLCRHARGFGSARMGVSFSGLRIALNVMDIISDLAAWLSFALI